MHDDIPDDARDTPVAARGLFRKKGRWNVVIEGDPGEHVAVDLSAGGLFLADVTGYPRGTRLQLSVGLADGVLSTPATVRWVRETRQGPMMDQGMGLLFDELSEADRYRILNEIQPPGWTR